MKKVLFVVHSLGGGGAERVLVNTVNNLPHDKYDITVMTIVDSGLHRRNLASHVKYRSLLSMPERKDGVQERNGSVSGSLLAGKSRFKTVAKELYLWFWRYAPTSSLYRSGVRERYDVEVAYLEGICTKFVAASPNDRAKKIAWVHVDIEKEGKSHKAFKSIREESALYDCFDKIVCVSQGVNDAMKRVFPSVAKKLVVARNPIDVQEITESAHEAIPAEYEPLFDKKYVFCSVGRLCEQKAFDRLVRAAALCKQQVKDDFSIVIMGEGPDNESLISLASELNVTDSVHFIGYQKNPYAFIARSHAFVCTSRAEGMSTTVSEALVLGVPVISTPCSGTDELSSFVNGKIIGDSDEEIANALCSEMDASRMHSRGDSSQVEEFFDLDRAISAIEEILADDC